MDFSVPQVMGILNATPDSFYEGSRKQTEYDIAERTRQIAMEGASIIDIGAFSTRPGAQEVEEAEESRRLQEAISIVRREAPALPISVDTYRPSVARRCIEEWGADIINDVSEGGIAGIGGKPVDGLQSMFDTIALLKVPYILTSVRSNLPDMLKAFALEVGQLYSLGVKDIILDPGFGFGKTLEENYQIMGGMEKLQALELPVMAGCSRKSMIYRLLDSSPDNALTGTTVLHTIALEKGATILRVHDVREAVEAITIFRQVYPERFT